jgi:hypothetical protein
MNAAGSVIGFADALGQTISASAHSHAAMQAGRRVSTVDPTIILPPERAPTTT